MKRKLQAVLFSALASTLILSSCSRDNSVASNHGIQKRKYTSGYHVHFKGMKKSVNEKEGTNEANLAKAEILEINSTEKILTQNDNVAAINKVSEMTTTIDVKPSNSLVSKEEVKSMKRNKVNDVEHKEISLSVNKTTKKEVKNNISSIKELSKKDTFKNTTDTSLEPLVYILLCLLIPFLAVGFATDWDVNDVIINLLLCLLCGIPGIIHAFVVCNREGVI